MTNSKKITIQFEGIPSEDGHVRLSEFIERLDALRSLLKKIDIDSSGENKATVFYQITNLSHSSPATVEIQAKPKEAYFDKEITVFEQFYSGLEHMKAYQKPPENFSYEVLDAYKKFIDKPFKTLSGFNVTKDGEETLYLSDELVATLEKSITGEFNSEGTMTGVLEAINIHRSPLKFTIYPLAGPAKLTCNFPPSKLESAISAVGRNVRVYGIFKYRNKANLPHEVEVKSFDVLPLDRDLPSLSSLRGVQPDATGGKGSVAFLRELRDAEAT